MQSISTHSSRTTRIEEEVGMPRASPLIDGTIRRLAGRIMVLHADAVQNDAFLSDLTRACWRGKPINTGDDGFVT